MSPTARSLKYLRDRGFTAEVVEKWIPGANIRRDFLGIIDILALLPGWPFLLGVQATTGSNLTARHKKALASISLPAWVNSGHLFECWGWTKAGKFWGHTGIEVHANTVLPGEWKEGQDAVRAAVVRGALPK